MNPPLGTDLRGDLDLVSDQQRQRHRRLSQWLKGLEVLARLADLFKRRRPGEEELLVTSVITSTSQASETNYTEAPIRVLSGKHL